MHSSQTDLGESVIFQPVLQEYPARHSWIITAHISLGNLECHCRLFNRQLAKMQQFIRSLDEHPSAPTQLLSMLQLELSNIQDIYHSGEATITSAISLLKTNQPQTHIHCRRNFTTLSWRCPQLAHWNSHNERHPQHQNMDKPTHCNTDITVQHPGSYCVHLEYHKVCHTG